MGGQCDCTSANQANFQNAALPAPGTGHGWANKPYHVFSSAFGTFGFEVLGYFSDLGVSASDSGGGDAVSQE